MAEVASSENPTLQISLSSLSTKNLLWEIKSCITQWRDGGWSERIYAMGTVVIAQGSQTVLSRRDCESSPQSLRRIQEHRSLWQVQLTHPFNIQTMDFNKQDKDIKRSWLSKVIMLWRPFLHGGIGALKHEVEGLRLHCWHHSFMHR
jgi:hypothetical protein